MPSGGQIGSGVQIAYSLLSPHTWVEIPEIREVSSLPNIERDRVETTIHGVTSLRTYIPGLGDVSDLEFTVRANLDASSVHSTLRTLERDQTTVWIRVEVPVTSNLSTTTFVAYTMQARCSMWELEAPIDDLKVLNITFQFEDNYMFQLAMAAAF